MTVRDDGLRFSMLPRCPWVGDDPLMVAYHDEEWGVPCHDDRALFERLTLEGFQAGLSWTTILRKREAFRRAFAGFDPAVVAGFGEEDETRLLADAGIVRNRAKVAAAIGNAWVFLATADEHGSFDRYLWGFVGGEPIRRAAAPGWGDVPATTPESVALSRDLKRRKFAFVGPTICYALMQSAGLVNDHVQGCFLARPKPPNLDQPSGSEGPAPAVSRGTSPPVLRPRRIAGTSRRRPGRTAEG